MRRKPNPLARPYKLSPEAQEQRRIAAQERWARLKGEERSLPGRPRKKRRHVLRDAVTGKFVKAVA